MMAEYIPDVGFENPNLYWEYVNEELLDEQFEDLVVEDVKEVRK